LAFQPGTFQIKLGLDKMKFFYERSEVFISNLEEAQRILVNDSRDIKYLLKGIHSKGPKLTIITDGVNGAYMFDGDHFYKMPMYPNPRPAVERTGCGDAFASTFVTYLALGMTPLESLIRAPINSMSVSQFIGSQEGLLEHEQVEWWLKKAPDDYKPQEI
jgi:sugar/nucleoside kinase (ribokinase family)